MILYADGCSLTYGEELPEETRERDCWPGVAARMLGADLVLGALPASSNDAIFRRVISFVSNYLAEGGDPDDLTVGVCWTEWSRREFGDTIMRHTPDETFYSSILMGFDDYGLPYFKKLKRIYQEYFDTDREGEQRYLNQVISVQSLLKLHGINYVFLNGIMDAGKFSQRFEPLKAMIDTRHFPNFRDPNGSFVQFSDSHRFPKGKGFHPLEEGHAAWGEIAGRNLIETAAK